MYPRLFLLFFPLLAATQTIPFRLGDAINLIPPATNADGNTVVFAAATAPDGTPQKATNLYVFSQALTSAAIRRLTNYSGDAPWTGVNSVSYSAGFAGYTAAANGPGGVEEVHLIDTTSAADRTLATDKEGCIQPLCVGCARPCVGPVHLTADGSKVLYAVSRQQPFFVVNADGSGLTRLPVYQGALAASPKRVISRGGVMVFTSSAPSGPTFAAAATDVYSINLDGTGLRQVTKLENPAFFASNSTISADGTWIAFESNFSDSGPQPVSQAWMVRPDGTGVRKISDGADAAASLSISADGSVVTFVQGGQIKRVTTSGGGTAPLALTSLAISVARDATVSDDGARVVFTLGPPSGPGAAVYRIPTDAPSDKRSSPRIYAPRFLSVNGVGSAAGTGAPSPGSLLSAYGANLGEDELVQAGTFPLPTFLSGLSLLVNGQAVPLLAVTPWQINAQLPQEVPAGTATFYVRDANGATLVPLSVTVESFAPVNFSYPFVQGRLYYPQAAAYHAGTGVPADMDHPVSAGETIEIYGLGLGVTEPVVEAGLASPSSPPARAVQTPRLEIGGRDAVVTFAGLAPGYAGVYQVNAIVPAGLAPGIQNLTWRGASGAVSYSSVAVK
jgi:uncharacterized protein (TIGR03437 family)